MLLFAFKRKAMNVKELISASLILFSIIDVMGNLPIIIDLKQKGKHINPWQTTLVSGVIMITFLFLGTGILGLFGIDVGSFALAGSLVIFIIGLEMTLGADFFKDDGEYDSASIFPVAFPLMAGAGTLTTIISLKSEYETTSILGAILINLVIIFLAVRFSDALRKRLGKNGTAILRKVYGIILLAIAIKLFKSNLGLALEG